MPTSKKRVSLTITAQMVRNLEVLWKIHPTMRDQLLESLQMLATLGATHLLSTYPAIPDQELAEHSRSQKSQPSEQRTLEPDAAIDNSEDWDLASI